MLCQPCFWWLKCPTPIIHKYFARWVPNVFGIEFKVIARSASPLRSRLSEARAETRRGITRRNPAPIPSEWVLDNGHNSPRFIGMNYSG
ncbi:MAG: hypothetical protein QME16_05340 [Planctomycetota bacterium]|nr:hypothetical protein [Planctomycetota bacterium]